MKSCAHCGGPTKHPKRNCCSVSCAAARNWAQLRAAGRLRPFEVASEQAQRTVRSKRFWQDLVRDAGAAGLSVTPAIKELYRTARNRGYHAGYECGLKRGKTQWWLRKQA